MSPDLNEPATRKSWKSVVQGLEESLLEAANRTDTLAHEERTSAMMEQISCACEGIGAAGKKADAIGLRLLVGQRALFFFVCGNCEFWKLGNPYRIEIQGILAKFSDRRREHRSQESPAADIGYSHCNVDFSPGMEQPRGREEAICGAKSTHYVEKIKRCRAPSLPA